MTTSPLPFKTRSDRVRGFVDIVDADGEPVAYLVTTRDAKLIVASVNAHADLLARLDRLTESAA